MTCHSSRDPEPDALAKAHADLCDLRHRLGITRRRLELTDDKPPKVAVISDKRNHGHKVYGLDEIVVVGRVICSLRLF